MCFVKLQRTWPFTTEIESVHPWVQADICNAFVETPPRRSWDIASTRKERTDKLTTGTLPDQFFCQSTNWSLDSLFQRQNLNVFSSVSLNNHKHVYMKRKLMSSFEAWGPWSWSGRAYSQGWMCFYTHTHTHKHSGRHWRLMNTLHRCTTTATVRVHAHVPASMRRLLKCCSISVLFVLLSADYGSLFSGLYVLWAWLQFDSGPACMCNHHNQNRNTPIRSAISLIAFN